MEDNKMKIIRKTINNNNRFKLKNKYRMKSKNKK